MAGPFSKSLQPFTAHLEDARECASYMRDSIRLKSHLGSIVNWQSTNKTGTALARSFRSREPVAVRSVLNGLFVTVIAAFEEFLRATIVCAVKETGRPATFDDLGEPLMMHHMALSGRLLRGATNPPAYPSLDYFELCRRLGTCLRGSDTCELNESAFAAVGGLLGMEPFFKSLDVLGWKMKWDDLCRHKDVQALLSTKGPREAGKRMKVEIQGAVRDRHGIAHSGQSFAELTDVVFAHKLKLFEQRIFIN